MKVTISQDQQNAKQSVDSQQFSICLEMDVGAEQVDQSFGQPGTFSSHLSRPDLAAMGVQKGARLVGIRLNRLTQMVARLSYPYHRVQIENCW
ncbi:MAG: hypothetical protein KJ063_17600 [Anaerolineae bacterium]|nr:hypothetical protein [Anaerolineae bacterium]